VSLRKQEIHFYLEALSGKEADALPKPQEANAPETQKPQKHVWQRTKSAASGNRFTCKKGTNRKKASSACSGDGIC
jgi:hypothetical protein